MTSIRNISNLIVSIGAGHIHGTLWLDLEKLSQVIDTTNPEGREAMDESVKDQLHGSQIFGRAV